MYFLYTYKVSMNIFHMEYEIGNISYNLSIDKEIHTQTHIYKTAKS